MKKILLGLLIVSGVLFAQAENLEGLKFQDLKVAEDALCPVKNVLLHKNKNFIGVIQYNNGKMDVVSSPKYTFRLLLQEGRKNHTGIYKMYVTDYKTKRLIDAGGAYYVFGSILMTSGGDDVIPFRLEDDAKAFMKEYRGNTIFRHERMDKRFIDFLDK